jgi:adenylate cyclase
MSKRFPIFLGILLIIIAFWLLITPIKSIRLLITNLDNLGYDLQLRARVLTHQHPKLSPVVIVDIDDRSLKTEGRWPWNRSKIAALVDQLQSQGAAIVAFDIFFSEKENNIGEVLLTKLNQNKVSVPIVNATIQKNLGLFDEDKVLAASLAKIQSVLAISFLPNEIRQNILPPPLLTLNSQQQALQLISETGYISNIPLLQQNAQGGGFINIFADPDGVMRRAPLIMVYKNNVYPSLALQAVLLLLGEKISLVTPSYDRAIKLEGIKIGDNIIPTDAQGQALIPFVGGSYTFPFYSATDVLHGRIAQDALFGKIVFVGTSATGLGDLHPSAIESPFPGVEMQATIVNGILQHHFSFKPEWAIGANIFFTILFGGLAAFIFPFLGPRVLGLILLSFPFCILFINNWIWEKSGLVLTFLIPILLVLLIGIVNIIYGYLFETRRREHLKEMFGQYVPEQHIDQMLKTKGSFALQGEDREMSVLFADIRSFTTISEDMIAAELVQMLNTFFTPMTEIIFKHKGTIDKYVGDLIMAFWGAPLKDRAHARHAIESALSMQKKVKAIRPILAEHHWPEIHIGIGVNSGVMSVGDMGSRFRRNYTVLGDAVNLASRMEGLTKYYGVDIIVSENTQKNQKNFVFRKLDYVQVKGKHIGVGLYELICKKEEATFELGEELSQYHQALDDYLQQKWEQAYQQMQKLHEQYPDRKIYSLYMERINELKHQQLPPDWNGVFKHESK